MQRSLRLVPLLAAVALAMTGAVPVAAKDGPRMIKDLRPGPDGLDNGQLLVFGALGSRVLFRADVDASTGPELYRTDATKAATGLVKDIKPGAGGSQPGTPFAVRNGIGYFTADDGTHGVELWRTNGTSAGTRMVKNIAPDAHTELSAYLWGTFRGDIVVQASDGNENGDHGGELWRSDGTAAGTTRMTDVDQGADDSLFAGVIQLGTRLLFISNDGSSGLELFTSNGTPAGTDLVEEINPTGDILPYPGGGVTPARFKGAIWFWAIDGVHGGELWKSDGTPSATKLVKDIAPGLDQLLHPLVPAALEDPDGLPGGRQRGRGALGHRRHDGRHQAREGPLPGLEQQPGLSARAHRVDPADGRRRRPGCGSGALPDRRHEGRHAPGQGPVARRFRLRPARWGGAERQALLRRHERQGPRAVGERRHHGRHEAHLGHQPRRRLPRRSSR